MNTVRELGKLLRSRKLSCVELIRQTFAAIESRERFRSFITLTEDRALRQAAERDNELAAGHDRGPFHGIPIALKDLFYTRGVLTTGGSLLFRNFVPEANAAVVNELEAAGAISVGKTNLHELAFGITSANPHYGAVLNPLDTERIPGGSSGGSAAAVTAGFVPMALGTDTGGSIRIPASYCGITGLKPTYGRVSRHNVMPLAFSLDHVGPLGTCAEDCALAMNAIADTPVPEFNLPALADFKGVRIGIPQNYFFERIDLEVDRQVRHSIALMEKAGAQLIEVSLPDMNAVNAAARVVQFAEFASLHTTRTDPSEFGPDVWALLQQGRMLAGHEYVNAQRLRTVFRREMDALWHKIHVLVTPTTPVTAPLLNQEAVRIGAAEENTRIASTRLVRAFNYLGEPALSMPCGQTDEGLPVGLQLIGAPFSEPKLLQIAKTLETQLL